MPQKQALSKMSNIDELRHLHTYLTYDDVLLLPNYSEIMPAEACVDASLCPTIELKMPILAAPMDTVTEGAMLVAIGQEGGLGLIHRNLTIAEQSAQLAAALALTSQAGAAVGVGSDLAERTSELVRSGVTLLCVDSAHGHTKNVMDAIAFIKKAYPHVPLMAGNIATYEGARALFEAGVDIVKVGMGPGSICTTRIMSGMGVPQLSALAEASRAAQEFGRTVIADGGIKASGDIVKALAAGASAVMLGSLLAGTEESPGQLVEMNGKSFKTYRGMGSVAAMAQGSAARYGQSCKEGNHKLVPEGVEGYVPYRGRLEDHLRQLIGGVRSGMAYLGARTIAELQEKARFIRISPASMLESHPHSILTKI